MAPQDSSGLVAALIVLLIELVVVAGLYVWTALALSRVFTKLGIDGWRAWVPVLNTIELYRLGGYNPLWVITLFLPIVQVAGLVVLFICVHSINLRFGKGAGFTVLAVLLFPVWASVLGFGSAQPGPAADAGAFSARMDSLGGAVPAAPTASFAAGSFGGGSSGGGSFGAAGVPAPPASAAPVVPAAPASPPAPTAPPTGPALQAPPPRLGGVFAAPAAQATPAPAAPPAPASASVPAPAPASASASAPAPAPGDPWAPPAGVVLPAAPPPPPSRQPAASDAGPSFPPVPPPPASAASHVGAAARSGGQQGESLVPPPLVMPGETPPVPAAAPVAPRVAAAAPVAPTARIAAIDDDPDDRTVIAGFEPDEADDDADKTVLSPRRRAPVWILTAAGGDEIRLTSDLVLVGRNPAASGSDITAQLVAVADPSKTTSKTHARLRLEAEGWTITDLDSTNGVVLIAPDGSETDLAPGAPVLVTETFLLGQLQVTLRPETR